MVRPKKHLGQHFLKDKNIASKIVQSLTLHRGYRQVLEIGPGTGVLTQFLVQDNRFTTSLIELDTESVHYLQEHYPDLKPRIFYKDFLKTDLLALMQEPFAVIGNFPYNISSQIFFKILDIKNEVPEVVCMLQKEVADRLKSPPGSKAYGILSVLLQAYYDIDYLFTVEPGVFNPPPRVRSGVIRLKRNDTQQLACDEQLFRKVVKQSFQTRRKTLRNALKPLNLPETIRQLNTLDLRAEQLSVNDFVELTLKIEESWKQEP
ncbi:16S rRNA (adenine1518-N6/adenine1519-N6)-dimethyltransferase [Catalinimonas alkaloidigena]|uniref:16S rRNA (adenine(1518)-N(6)/adenine(1519)-N(6))- dimethyltransferase RsmA n=1 Tax=Catalinimonas alkaloidigena TaxID=1075417 RepID=UPI00240543EA|nr:16S rRNA (adenine(1518)-N(6)/adenine(1519)-N(6))-dimethyltransferase RsmA [Catalinimonas alkaloidigena]MDF9799546.1 16S rRNA (adenine1518-N6/adenine1519-N6)-dimethyltransferase [Catalinimonas alkaloidigena]